MDLYSTVEVQQIAPVLALCLGTGRIASQLRDGFDKVNLSGCVWDNFIIKNRLSSAKYILRFVDSQTSVVEAVSRHRIKSPASHSSLSPFNVASDLFPNGIISDTWFAKYLQDLPFALVSVHEVGADSDLATLGNTLASASKLLATHTVGFIAIVVSNGDVKNDSETLDSLRRTSGLPYKSKLFYINSNAENVEQECSVVVSSIIKSLKSSALEFYSAIERRVYERSGKYYNLPVSKTKTNIQLSPKILETRNLIKRGVLLQFMNSHNIEPSLDVLEHAYENILQLISENAAAFSPPQKTPHDASLYRAWIRLLDVLIIHLVRGYFSIEQPIAALRKHQAHVAIGQRLLSTFSIESVALWAATQYHWLADLMALVPEGILNTKQKGSKQNLLQFFGGVKLSDDSHVTTFPYMVYAKAASSIRACVDISHLQSDLLSVNEPNDILKYKGRLLKQAYDYNQSSSYHSDTYGSFIKWQMAQNFIAMDDYTEAYKSFEGINPTVLGSSPSILEKLLMVAAKLPNKEQLLREVLRHSFPDYGAVKSSHLYELPSISKTFESSTEYFKVEASIFNSSENPETQAFDDITSQTVLTSKFSSTLLKRYFKDIEVSVEIQCINLIRGDGTQLKYTCGGKQMGQVQTARTEFDTAQYNFSVLNNEPLVLLSTETAKTTGFISVSRVDIQSNIMLTAGSTKLNIQNTEVHKFDLDNPQNSIQIFRPDCSSTTLRLQGRPARSLLVKPYVPKLHGHIISRPSFIVLGEKVKLPINITSDGIPLEKVTFKEINVYVKSTIFKGPSETKDLSVRINWSGLKDDEPWDLLGPIKAKETDFSPVFHASINKSPNVTLESLQNCKARFEFVVSFVDQSGAALDLSLFNTEVPVYSQVFRPTFETLPQVTPNSGSASSVFVVNPEKMEFSPPMPSRTWQLRTELNPQHELLKSNQVLVNSVELNIGGKNTDINVNWVSEAEENGTVICRSFEIRGKHLSSPNSITVTVDGTIGFSRPEAPEKMFQKLEPRDFVLQLLDPRLLFSVQKVDNVYEFHYIVENPTSRTFTFSTSMITDKALLQGSRWNFEDARNQAPLSNNLIHVLPRGAVKLAFYGTVSSEKAGEIQLPQLQVFDVNYKVSLPAVQLARKI